MSREHLTKEELRQYWSDLSEASLGDDPTGLSAVCYAGLPHWFNAFIDRYQRKAFRKLMADSTFESVRTLDIGTGVGRWGRWFASFSNAHVIGIDIDKLRLRWAEARGNHRADYCTMSVDCLAFQDGRFDVVNCVTVLQHVDHDTKHKAVTEIARVLKPGGQAIVFELIDEADDAPHVFPWSRDTWITEFRARGLTLVKTVGDQYTPLLRLALVAFKRLRGSRSRQTIDAIKKTKDRSVDQHLYLALLRVLVMLSYPAEELCSALVPPRFATRNGYLLRKDEQLPRRLEDGAL